MSISFNPGATDAGGQGIVKKESKDLSGDTVEFNNSITSSTHILIAQIVNVQVEFNDSIFWQVSTDGGLSWKTGSGDYASEGLTRNIGAEITDPGNPGGITLKMFNPQNGNYPTGGYWSFVNESAAVSLEGSISYSLNSAVDAFRLRGWSTVNDNPLDFTDGSVVTYEMVQ